eukprot:SAG31_NODE_2676_length_5264_cov_576.907278_2_plen_70_part_00
MSKTGAPVGLPRAVHTAVLNLNLASYLATSRYSCIISIRYRSDGRAPGWYELVQVPVLVASQVANRLNF